MEGETRTKVAKTQKPWEKQQQLTLEVCPTKLWRKSISDNLWQDKTRQHKIKQGNTRHDNTRRNLEMALKIFFTRRYSTYRRKWNNKVHHANKSPNTSLPSIQKPVLVWCWYGRRRDCSRTTGHGTNQAVMCVKWSAQTCKRTMIPALITHPSLRKGKDKEGTKRITF